MDLWSRKNGTLRGLGRSSAPFGRRVRGFDAGCAEGLCKKVLKMDRPLAGGFRRYRGFRGFWRCPYGRIIKKRRPGFISQRGIGKH